MILLVDVKNRFEFGIIAQTNSKEKFYKNLKTIGEEYNYSFMEAYIASGHYLIDIQILGRFITIIQLGETQENPYMVFHDTENNEENALGIAVGLMFSAGDGTMNEAYMIAFMDKFYELRSLYRYNYSLVDLLYSETEAN